MRTRYFATQWETAAGPLPDILPAPRVLLSQAG